MHVTHTQPGNEAGNGGEEMAVGARVSVSAERQERAGQAGHSDAEVQDGDICQRLFLARARGMQQVRDAEKQHRFLANEDHPQPRTRPPELRHPFAERLAGDCALGMPVGQGHIRNNHAAGRCGTE